ncbi:MAG: hypothetical protein E6J74_16775 [Deltaproteobacteria bacterium]|nr:MAG: hypothetical protein E6J74_16775 [Deltaproteobacteria bacterium]
MKRSLVIVSFVATFVCSATLAFAQAFGEYGRTLGGVPHGPGITGSRAPGGVTQGSAGTGGIGDVGGPALPTRLVVATKDAGLYPRQDEESEKLFQLAQGETLIPMVQSAGGSEWYMVKTQKGLVGWVKSTDVREEKLKKK